MTISGKQTRPTPPAGRSLGPDLARGFMLLFIALANSHYFLRGETYFGGFPVGGSALDRAVGWAISTFVDGRAFPMFGVLFGYGVARIAARSEALGPRGVRRLLWRRAAVLVVVGFLHALLLFAGDILAAYGVLLLFGAWTVRWRDRWLLVVALAFFVLLSLPGIDSSAISTEGPDPSMLPPDVAAQLTSRPWVTLYVGLLGPFGFVGVFLVGLWAGRRRLLERPERHRVLLGGVAVGGIGAAVLGAQPAALVVAGVLDPPGPDVLRLIGPLHDSLGTLGGLGYAAALALLASRLAPSAGDQTGQRLGPLTSAAGPSGPSGPASQRLGPLSSAIAAVGQRSMTCYLCQSVVWAAVFSPFLLDLSDDLTTTTTALLALATWLTTVTLATWMSRTGRRGPFEVLIRRVTYRTPEAVRSPRFNAAGRSSRHGPQSPQIEDDVSSAP